LILPTAIPSILLWRFRQRLENRTDLPWLLVWQYLRNHIKDDEGTAPGAKPNNRSNRFEVANQINALLSADGKAAGPFWCASPEAAYLYIPQRGPREPFQTAQGYVVKSLRLTDKRARSGSPFRLFGTASVGSQSLTGIARLHQLRNDAKFSAISAVWPFETGWATKAKWLPKHVSILHAEIYPSVRNPMPDEIKDRGQVRAMWQWYRLPGWHVRGLNLKAQCKIVGWHRGR
jgi:precorrin-8X/cobalt-precorrin-8 methylmutase